MRKLAREVCFELIFEILVRDEGEMNPLSFSTLCEQENILDDQDKDYVNKIVNTFVQNKEEIKHSFNGWCNEIKGIGIEGCWFFKSVFNLS